MTDMHIKERWDRLSPATRQWFLDNPGCVIVPRTITNCAAEARVCAS
ncbi:hypothetical protein [Pseudarthrobacter albicanus]|nr:hypothetical protein [Pseudarthrobacter albicanus]